MNLPFDIGYVRKKNSLNLFAWNEVENYGDKLGPAIFHLLSKKPIYIDARGLRLIFDQGDRRVIFCFLGTMAQLIYGPHKFIFWGFGTTPTKGPAHHGSKPIEKNLDIEFRALRGPLTRDCLIKAGYQVPENIPYGDPGLLAPYFFKRAHNIINDFCVIPHHSLYEQWRDKFSDLNVLDIKLDNYNNLQKLIDKITKYKVIFSSSLHVTILAESFGIPTIPIEPRLEFKFDDFYASCNKKMSYIKNASKDLDWDMLCKKAINNWQPISWDPEPFLGASPFDIDPNIKPSLVEHYKKLKSGDIGLKLAGGYISDAQKEKFSVLKEQKTNKILYSSTNVGGFKKWKIYDELSKNSIKIYEDGYEITESGYECYLTSPFIKLHNAIDEININIELQGKDGTTEVRLQDEKYETWNNLKTEKGQNNVHIKFWPVRRDMELRLVFFPLRGKVIIKKMEIISISMV